MGSHYSAVAVRPALDDLLQRIVPAGVTLKPSSKAPSGGNDGVMELGQLGDPPAWTVLWGDVFLGWENLSDARTALDHLAEEVDEVLHWAVESTSGTQGFTLWREGKCVRSWWEREGTVVENEGASLPFEPPGVFTNETDVEGNRDEWSVVVPPVEGIVGPWEEITAINQVVFDVVRPAEHLEDVRSQPWWHFWKRPR